MDALGAFIIYVSVLTSVSLQLEHKIEFLGSVINHFDIGSPISQHAVVMIEESDRKSLMKSSVDFKYHLTVLTCSGFKFLKNSLAAKIFLNCNLKNTISIIRKAKQQNLFIRPYSWFVLTENLTAVEESFAEKNPEAVNNVLLVNQLLEPFLMDESKPGLTKYTGIDYNFMEDIRKSLGFSLAYAVTQFSSILDGSASPEVYMFDIMGPPFMAETDANILQKSPPITHTAYCFYIKTPVSVIAEDSVKSYLLPFSRNLWFCVSGVVVVTAVSWAIARALDQSHTCISILWECVNDVICIITFQGTNNAPRSLSTKIMVTSFNFFALLILSCYSTFLVSFLTNNRVPIPFKSFDAMGDSDYHFYTNLGHGRPPPLFQGTENDTTKYGALYRKTRFELVGEPGEKVESVFPKLGKHVMIFYREKGDYFLKILEPNLTFVMATDKRLERNIAFRSGFPHQKIIFDTARRFFEGGILNKRTVEEKNRILKYSPRNEETRGIRVNVVFALILIWAAGMAASLFALILEIIFSVARKS